MFPTKAVVGLITIPKSLAANPPILFISLTVILL
jgi:hypothetical protein